MAVLVMLAVALTLAVALLGGGDDRGFAPGAQGTSGPAANGPPTSARAPGPVEIERLSVGEGARSATVFRPKGQSLGPGVVFLHGWGQVAAADYGPWLRHLARRGNTVIFPRYQRDASSAPDRALDDAIAGVRAALREAPIAPGSLVIAGHSAGAALAADLAVVAEGRGLPSPVAVFSVYPGRALKRYPAGIPAEDPVALPAGMRLVVLAGAADEVVGEGPARLLVDSATGIAVERRSLIRVTDPAAADHYAPERSSSSSRTAFWRPLDQLMRAARAEG